MKELLKLALVLVLALVMMTACSKKSEETTTAPAQEQSKPAEEPAAPQVQEQAAPADEKPAQDQTEAASSDQADPQIDEISGTVVKTEDGIAIFSDEGNFTVAGQDLTDLVGKNVKATGTIDEGSGKPVITITSVTVLE